MTPFRPHLCLPVVVTAARCIDRYIEQRVKAAEEGTEAEVDPRMTAIVERMFDRHACCAVLCGELLSLLTHWYPEWESRWFL